MRSCILIVSLFVLATGLSAQPVSSGTKPVSEVNKPDSQIEEDDTKGISFAYGMNLGSYFAFQGTANYYNGSGQYGLEQLINSSYQYNKIRQDLTYDFQLHELPQNMRYNPAMMLGFFGKLQFNKIWGLIGEFNYVRLRTEDQFTLLLDRYSSIQGDNIERYAIRGEEERIDLRIGIQINRPSRHFYIHPFVEAGLGITDTEVKRNTASIAGQSYRLNRPANPRNTLYERDYGMSVGGYASMGVKMEVNPHFHLTLAYSGQHTKINLGDNDTFGWQHSLFIRLNLNSLIPSDQ
jgi:hypothetical protein